MRTLVLMLVLLNLGFFLWQWQNPLPVADRSRLFAQPEGESQAQLITGQAVPDVAETSPFLSSAPVASMVAAAPVEPEVPEVESEVVAELELELELELEPELEQGQEVAGPEAQSIEEAAVAAPTTDASSEPESSPAEEMVAVPVEPEPVLLPSCYTLGSFARAGDAASASEKLTAAGIDATTRIAQESRVVGYFVLLPYPGSMEQSHALVREIKAKGVKDYWLFRKDELKGAVSLGLYDRIARAERRRAQLAADNGVEAEVAERRLTKDRWWLDFSSTVDSPVGEALRGDLDAIESGIVIESRECSEFVSPPAIP